MTSSPFDRLAGPKRNRRMRNAFGITAAIALFLAVIFILDPMVSGTRIHFTSLFILGLLFVISFSFATYFHLRFLTRE